MTAGELLREARRRHGLTQRQLAARARTSQAAVSRVERGVVSPSVATLATWLELMGEELELSSSRIDYGHDLAFDAQQLRLPPGGGSRGRRAGRERASSRAIPTRPRAARSL